MASHLAALVLAALLIQYVVEAGLLTLNLRHAGRARGVPPPLGGRVDEATAERSRSYAIANGRFALAHGAWGLALALAGLFSGVLPRLDGALARAGASGGNRFVAFVALVAAAFWIADLPFTIWHTFVVEARFGFNRTSFGLWLSDLFKGVALALILGVPFLYGTYAFMRFTGSLWWVWLFGFVTAVQLLLLWIWPSLIAPLFNKFRPLPDGGLKARLESLARAAGFRNRGLFVVDASRRSGHSNAYFSGLVRPRIVLFDTLVKEMSPDEAGAVLAHEIGHFKRRHVHRRLAVSLAGTLAVLFVLSLIVPWPPLYAAFGFAAPSLHAALVLASLGGGGFVFWLAPLSSAISRRHEYEADRYSLHLAERPEALKSALVRLGGQNLSNLHPHPWYSAWHYSHPTLVERLEAIDRTAQARTSSATPST